MDRWLSDSASRYLRVLLSGRVGITPGQFVRLVEHYQVKCGERSRNQPLPHCVRGGRVDTDNEEPRAGFCQRVALCKIRATQNREVKVEEVPEFTAPVPGQPSWRAYERSLQSPAVDHLPDVKPGHYGFARSSIVSKEEPERILRQHLLVDGNPLMWERNNARELQPKRLVEYVAVLYAGGHPRRASRRRHRLQNPDKSAGMAEGEMPRAPEALFQGPRLSSAECGRFEV